MAMGLVPSTALVPPGGDTQDLALVMPIAMYPARAICSVK